MSNNMTKIEVSIAPKTVLCVGTLRENDVFRVRESGNVYIVTRPAQSLSDEVLVHCLVEARHKSACGTFGYNFSDFVVASKVEVQFD